MQSMVEGGLRRRDDRGNHRIHVSRHVNRRHPQHAEPVLPYESNSHLVMSGALTIMRRAIHFDDKPRTQAAEVDHIGPNRMLLAKLQPKRLSAKLLPQQHLGIGHFPPQPARDRHFRA